MWVMASFGILMPSLRPEGTVPEGDNRLIQVRTRREKDLEILRAEYMGDELGDIVQIPHSDYEYRAYCTHEAWARALAKIAMDIDFVKFKPTTEDKYKDAELHSVYNAVWSTVFNRLSTPEHQADYLNTGWTSSVGKYGTTYGGTGNFSYGSGYTPAGKGKGKKGQKKAAGKYASVGGGRQPWWADAEAEPQTIHWWDDAAADGYIDPYYNDRDDLGLGRPTSPLVTAMKRGSGRQGVDFGNTLVGLLDDVDPADRPVFRTDGDIDHLYCNHGISKSARKRCRARWRRYAANKTRREFGIAY